MSITPKLISFIETTDFEVHILGHSCGISDRLLLNTIFENKNCKKIYPHYCEFSDKSTDFDNRTMNISRCFNDKMLLRKKVQIKELCSVIYRDN